MDLCVSWFKTCSKRNTLLQNDEEWDQTVEHWFPMWSLRLRKREGGRRGEVGVQRLKKRTNEAAVYFKRPVHSKYFDCSWNPFCEQQTSSEPSILPVVENRVHVLSGVLLCCWVVVMLWCRTCEGRSDADSRGHRRRWGWRGGRGRGSGRQSGPWCCDPAPGGAQTQAREEFWENVKTHTRFLLCSYVYIHKVDWWKNNIQKPRND